MGLVAERLGRHPHEVAGIFGRGSPRHKRALLVAQRPLRESDQPLQLGSVGEGMPTLAKRLGIVDRLSQVSTRALVIARIHRPMESGNLRGVPGRNHEPFTALPRLEHPRTQEQLRPLDLVVRDQEVDPFDGEVIALGDERRIRLEEFPAIASGNAGTLPKLVVFVEQLRVIRGETTGGLEVQDRAFGVVVHVVLRDAEVPVGHRGGCRVGGRHECRRPQRDCRLIAALGVVPTPQHGCGDRVMSIGVEREQESVDVVEARREAVPCVAGACRAQGFGDIPSQLLANQRLVVERQCADVDLSNGGMRGRGAGVSQEAQRVLVEARAIVFDRQIQQRWRIAGDRQPEQVTRPLVQGIGSQLSTEEHVCVIPLAELPKNHRQQRRRLQVVPVV